MESIVLTAIIAGAIGFFSYQSGLRNGKQELAARGAEEWQEGYAQGFSNGHQDWLKRYNEGNR